MKIVPLKDHHTEQIVNALENDYEGMQSIGHRSKIGLKVESDFWNPTFVATDGAIVLGFITGDSDSVYSVMEISKMYVISAHRGKGVGTKLIKELEQYSKSLNLGHMELLTFTEDGKRFYEKNGYRVITDYMKPYIKGIGQRRIILHKPLKPGKQKSSKPS